MTQPATADAIRLNLIYGIFVIGPQYNRDLISRISDGLTLPAEVVEAQFRIMIEEGYFVDFGAITVAQEIMTPAARREFARISGQRACRECGCTQEWACAGGCAWAERDLCTSCAGTSRDRL